MQDMLSADTKLLQSDTPISWQTKAKKKRFKSITNYKFFCVYMVLDTCMCF